MNLTWRTSSYTNNGTCVAVAVDGDRILMRNSNHPDAGTATFTRAEMDAFFKGVKAGEFDDCT